MALNKGFNGTTASILSASQAENASSIFVARSKDSHLKPN